MKTKMKLVAGALVAAGFAAAGPSAMAAVSLPPPPDCATGNTIATLIGNGGCTSGDKIYADFAVGGDLPAASIFNATYFTINGVEIHNAQVIPSDGVNNQTLPPALEGTYLLQYTLTITNPERYFGGVSINSDVPTQTSGVTFTKIVDNDGILGNGYLGTLTSLNGAQSSILDVSGSQLKKLWIYETVVVSSTGAVNSFTDTYTQLKVPEPGSLALLGLGLAGLAAVRRRRT